MSYSKFRFTLDLQGQQSQVSIPIKRYDKKRRLYISLSDGGSYFSIPTNWRAVLVIHKPDGTQLWHDCIIENNINVRYDFTEETASVGGIHRCELCLLDEDGEHAASSAEFTMIVNESVHYASSVVPEKRVIEITLYAEAWAGNDNSYSQEIVINGATINTKVDLQPSAEQLRMFHEKDIGFTTENDNGIITVFAVGDKPSRDYTMQATLTEVTS